MRRVGNGATASLTEEEEGSGGGGGTGATGETLQQQ
jgi:hypothetical protein